MSGVGLPQLGHDDAGPASITGAGWVFDGVQGTLAVAHHVLDTGSVETPPNPTVNSSRSDTWAACFAYIG